MSFCLQTKFFCRFDADTSYRRGRIACISHIKQMAQRVYSNIEHPIYCNQFAVMCTIRKSFKIRLISCGYRINILDFDLNMSLHIQHFGMLVSIFMLNAIISIKYIVC